MADGGGSHIIVCTKKKENLGLIGMKEARQCMQHNLTVILMKNLHTWDIAIHQIITRNIKD